MTRFGLLLSTAILAVPLAVGAPSLLRAATDANFAVVHGVLSLGTLITNTARAPATVNSADQSMGTFRNVRCTYDQSAHVGSPSTVITIQAKDPVSGKYETVIASSGVTADDTPTSVSAGVGVPTTTNVSSGVPMTSTWRVSETITTATSTTGTVSCQLSK